MCLFALDTSVINPLSLFLVGVCVCVFFFLTNIVRVAVRIATEDATMEMP